MSMKTSDSPRRIYSRNGIIHVCFEGKTWAPPKGETALSLEHDVVCEKAASDGGRARVIVTQKRKGQKNQSETWSSVQVPRNARSE
jgi:hypothetical protein